MNDSESTSIIGKSLNHDLLSTVEKIGKVQGYDGTENERTPVIEEVEVVNPTLNEAIPLMNARPPSQKTNEKPPSKKSSNSVRRLESIKR